MIALFKNKINKRLKLKEPNHKIKDATAYMVAVLKKKGFNMSED